MLKINWKYTLLVVIDLVIAAYLFMAFTSWHEPVKKVTECRKVIIKIADENENGFLNKPEIEALLNKQKIYPLYKPVSEINPRQIETQLSRMPFVKNAQCYLTSEGHVCISVTQRTPIIRVKSNKGEDYYVDDNGGIMPNSQYTSDMIIVSGSISRNYACRYIAVLAQVIMDDDFWRNQIEQINVLPDHSLELIPRVGDHVVNIGQLPAASNEQVRNDRIREFVTRQLHRLDLFYRYGLVHAGWNKYDYISLEYSNQVVCRRREQVLK